MLWDATLYESQSTYIILAFQLQLHEVTKLNPAVFLQCIPPAQLPLRLAPRNRMDVGWD